LKLNTFLTARTSKWVDSTRKDPAEASRRLVEQLRLIKDADEISQIRASVLLAASLYQTALRLIKPGVAEMQSQANWSCKRDGRGGEDVV